MLLNLKLSDITSDIEYIELSVYNSESKLMNQLIGYTKLSYQEINRNINSLEPLHLSVPEKSKIPLNIPVIHQHKLLKSNAEINSLWRYIDAETKLNIEIEEKQKRDSRRRKKEIMKIFNLDEDYIDVYSCICEPLHKGKIYLTEKNILFNSPFKQKLLEINSISSIELTKRSKMFNTTCTITFKDGNKVVFKWIKHIKNFIDELKKVKSNIQINGDIENVNDDLDSISESSNSISSSPKLSFKRRIPSLFLPKSKSSKRKSAPVVLQDQIYSTSEVESLDNSDENRERENSHRLKKLILSGKDDLKNDENIMDSAQIITTSDTNELKSSKENELKSSKESEKNLSSIYEDSENSSSDSSNHKPYSLSLVTSLLNIFTNLVFVGVVDLALTFMACFLINPHILLSHAYIYAFHCSLISVLYLTSRILLNFIGVKIMSSNQELLLVTLKNISLHILIRTTIIYFLPTLNLYSELELSPLFYDIKENYISIFVYIIGSFAISLTNNAIYQ